MQICKTKQELKDCLAQHSRECRVLVPTMGALHEGHASLLRQGRQLAGDTGVLVGTIFLNPVQFNRSSDLASYPVSPDADIALCTECGVDVLFMPSVEEMYMPDRSIIVEERDLSSRLCGATRPGHFAGVCLVVHKLFNLVAPSDALFGKKDYQQLAIIRRLVRDMDIAVKIHGVETVRADDGLALSSRNLLLSHTHRAAAPQIRASLLDAKARRERGESVVSILAHLRSQLEAIAGVKVDYAEMLDADDLRPLRETSRCALLALAAYFGEVRLIDNIEIPTHDHC